MTGDPKEPGPRKDNLLRVMGRVVETLRGSGYHSADEQARVLLDVALMLQTAGTVIQMQAERREAAAGGRG